MRLIKKGYHKSVQRRKGADCHNRQDDWRYLFRVVRGGWAQYGADS